MSPTRSLRIESVRWASHGLPLPRGAWYLFAAQALGVAGRVVLGARSDRLGPSRRMRPVEGLVVAAGALFVLPLLSPVAGPGALFVVAAVLGFFAFGWYGP